MTRDEARQLLPIIQAYAEGKEIEARDSIGGPSYWYSVGDGQLFTLPASYPFEKKKWAQEWADRHFGYRVIRMREVL